MSKRYVTTGEAADDIGVSTATLLRWLHDGTIKPAGRTRGGHFRWDLDDMRKQLDEPPEPAGGRMIDPDAPLHPPIVAAIITGKDGVLIERRHDGRPLWTFPAGEAEPGEAPTDTAIRETKEETGLEIKVSHVIGERDHPKTGRHMIYLAARAYQGTAVIVGDEDELAEVRWVGLAEAEQLLTGLYEPVHEHLVQTLS